MYQVFQITLRLTVLNIRSFLSRSWLELTHKTSHVSQLIQLLYAACIENKVIIESDDVHHNLKAKETMENAIRIDLDKSFQINKFSPYDKITDPKIKIVKEDKKHVISSDEIMGYINNKKSIQKYLSQRKDKK